MPRNHGKTKPIEVNGAKARTERASLTVEEREQVYRQIRERHSKTALQMAKDIHKRSGSDESEELLADAYRARIEDLLRLRMTVEAKALLAIVRERMPRVSPRLDVLDREVDLLEGRFEQIVAPLRDPELKLEERERIEMFIRQRVEDLPALAGVASLPADHPIRDAAKTVAAAFEAVTRGPAEPGLLALSEVSRRSPLSSWKGLIRAIDSYYRNETEECRRWLATIAADSVPARLLPAMHALCGNGAAGLSPAAKRLAEAVGDRGAALRQAAVVFDQAVAARKHKPILEAARKVMEAAGHLPAAERDRLRQHLVILCMKGSVLPSAIKQFLGAYKEDAYYLRMLALAMEDMGSGYAVLAWSDFRDLAIRDSDRWFAAGGPEDGALSLRMARLVERMPRDTVEDLVYDDGSMEPRALQRLRRLLSSPEPLFASACQADPSAECFQAWLDWAKKRSKPKNADDVAERWRKALPGDVRPLLHLVESAEERKAFKKSLTYLEEAEKLDGLNPAVRRASLRLLLAAALRHLGQGKAHLASGEIADILLLQEGPLRECTVLAYAVGWFCTALENDKAAMDEKAAALAQMVGVIGRHLLLMAIAEAAKAKAKLHLPEYDLKSSPPGELLAQTARICQLGELAGLHIPMQYGWNDDLVKHLQRPCVELDAAQLLALGEAALMDDAHELAYATSAAGLAIGKAAARFLFLRGRALPFWAFAQSRGCTAAAVALARQERDTELTGRILDWMHNSHRNSYGWMRGGGLAVRPIAEDLLSAILQEERERNTIPVERKYSSPRYHLQLTAHEAGGLEDSGGPEVEFEDGDEEDDWDEVEDEEPIPTVDLEAMLGSLFDLLPPGSVDRIDAAVAAGGNAMEEVKRIMAEMRKTPAPTAKARVPEQRSLFGEEE